jgi:dATP pyrophosphohydrolase
MAVGGEPGPDARRYKRPESVLVVVYARSGSVLMLRRADDASFWQSVTGSLRWDEELPEQAARRELSEETGLADGYRLRDWRRSHRFSILPAWRARFAPGVATNLEHVFSAELPQPVPVRLHPQEHSEYEWLSFPEAARRASSWTNREAIEELAGWLAAGATPGA